MSKSKKTKKELTESKRELKCTEFQFYDESKKYLIYLGYVSLEKKLYSVYYDKDEKDIYIYKVKKKRKRNRLFYIENEEEFMEVRNMIFSIIQGGVSCGS